MRRCRWLVLAALTAAVCASSGDQDPHFQQCLTQCDVEICNSSSSSYTPALSLWLTRWTCNDDCKYSCMHWNTDMDIQRGEEVQQYYGKWPFRRFAGMQEPASVAFSLLNLWFHILGDRNVRRRVPNEHPMKSYYLTWSLISINAWMWSAVFHTRDLPFTEKMDYFSAASAILYGLYYSVIRLFHIYTLPQRDAMVLKPHQPANNQLLRRLWSVICTLLYLRHVTYLSLLPRFDYSYNIMFNLVLGLTYNALWLAYALPASMSVFQRFPSKPKSYRPSSATKPAILVTLTMLATSFELFDFPPWNRIIDAHALWHLSTALLVTFLYRFIIEDSLDEGWRGHKASGFSVSE